jgi:hypothetical protein
MKRLTLVITLSIGLLSGGCSKAVVAQSKPSSIPDVVMIETTKMLVLRKLNQRDDGVPSERQPRFVSVQFEGFVTAAFDAKVVCGRVTTTDELGKHNGPILFMADLDPLSPSAFLDKGDERLLTKLSRKACGH